MALPASGAISLNAVNVELNRAGTTQISLNEAAVRTLFAISSGQIAMSDGYGKSASGVPYVNGYSATPSNICYYSENRNTSISWNVSSGGLPITVYLQRAPYNTCSWGWANGGSAIGTMSTLGGFSINPASWHTGNVNMAYRLILINSSGSITTAGVGVVADYCTSETFCSYGNCQNQGQPGCYNCSESCTCDPCYYDTNCDGGYGYGTNGCGASCNCDYCSDYYLNWPDPNPDWPCNGPCVTCDTNCTCPCGETCPSNQFEQTCDTDQAGYFYGTSTSSC